MVTIKVERINFETSLSGKEQKHSTETAMDSYKNFDYEITAAYGYATREKGSRDSLETILQHADEKMYEYKAKQKSSR